MSQRPKLQKKIGAFMVTIQQHIWCVASDSRSMLDFSVDGLDAVDSAGGWVGVDGWTVHHQDVSIPHLLRLQCDRHTMNSRGQSASRLPARIRSLQISGAGDMTHDGVDGVKLLLKQLQHSQTHRGSSADRWIRAICTGWRCRRRRYHGPGR